MLWIGQRTLTPLIYPNKHSLSLPPWIQGLSPKPFVAPPCPEPLTRPSLLCVHLNHWQHRIRTHTHTLTYAHTHTHTGISHTRFRIRKQNVREGSAEASGKAELNLSLLSAFLLRSIRSQRERFTFITGI